jgi:D-alanyl-lipoteichoic acid acyltransferase DltB (MBOAT superfamily)
VDVYRGKYEPERNLFLYALHITYVPHLLIGPIEPYPQMKNTLLSRRFSWDGISEGGIRFVWGLFKKYVIAARAGVIIGAISAKPEEYSGVFAFGAMVLYSLQLYADFSGGIDMVLGGSKMLGITMSENFDAPYFSQSVSEFWRRWHMTLGGWLREYVYIPLGGNRKGKVRKVLNLIVTFLVSGLWHGAEYILWGLFNGIFVAFGETCRTKWKLLNQIGTFLLITFLWAFFVWPDMGTAVKMVLSVFTNFNFGAFFETIGTLGLTVTDWVVLSCGTLILWAYDWKKTAIGGKIHAMSPAARTAVACALGLSVLVFGMYGIGFNASAFIYSQF